MRGHHDSALMACGPFLSLRVPDFVRDGPNGALAVFGSPCQAADAGDVR